METRLWGGRISRSLRSDSDPLFVLSPSEWPRLPHTLIRVIVQSLGSAGERRLTRTPRRGGPLRQRLLPLWSGAAVAARSLLLLHSCFSSLTLCVKSRGVALKASLTAANNGRFERTLTFSPSSDSGDSFETLMRNLRLGLLIKGIV